MDGLDSAKRVEALKGLPISVSVRVCGRSLTLAELLKWTPGTILPFEQHATGPLHLNIGERTIAAGQAVKVGEKFGIQVRHISGREPSSSDPN